MRKSEPIQWVFRVLFYVLGLFVMALGVAIAANSNLGISPVNSLPYVVSEAVHRDPGTCVTLVFCSYILLQIIILRREFKWINLLQIVFSTIFGYFVNFTKTLVGDFAIPTYAGQLFVQMLTAIANGEPFTLTMEPGKHLHRDRGSWGPDCFLVWGMGCRPCDPDDLHGDRLCDWPDRGRGVPQQRKDHQRGLGKPGWLEGPLPEGCNPADCACGLPP